MTNTTVFTNSIFTDMVAKVAAKLDATKMERSIKDVLDVDTDYRAPEAVMDASDEEYFAFSDAVKNELNSMPKYKDKILSVQVTLFDFRLSALVTAV